MPPIKRNPKFELWKIRAEAEGTTSANRMTTDNFITDELPESVKPSAREFTTAYRTVVDLPGHLLNVVGGVALMYAVYAYNH